ncbi:hypothetical protein [Mesomycoplasma lagogenitalium]|uniref:Uncharacterized protein n=1 Tax=Mesomycoplasma lagogenitalium TaxID=171286 RepID=A0ABY8LU18_9BACT|nr:hypothetical protein [Mesomycoplasma lagogenitalium]WGI36724.1 hypothetical protein QEG99_00340 [Mesomycoplasma lagogenitalium]
MKNNKTLVSLKEAIKIIKQYEKHQCKIDFKDEKKCRIIMEGEKLKMQETSEKKITLKSLYNLVLNMQNVLLDVQKQTNENSSDIKDIKVVLAQHSQDIKEIKEDIKMLKSFHEDDIQKYKDKK